eukprot:gb/GFBE01026851.1/.p1 GENE.gb/GFBE01026851.1/~~gb/GFBE01026851.1/.p1  ORF type:complete len:127 (+),score=29.24 gb/GFBE01026851.1/:1-381(+)
MNSTEELEAACTALLGEGQVGEIYVIGNDPNCSTCLRMAIYNLTTADNPGREVGVGAGKWVCVKGAVAAPELDCTTTTTTGDTTTNTTAAASTETTTAGGVTPANSVNRMASYASFALAVVAALVL